MDELRAELPKLSLEGVESFKKNLLSPTFIESYYNGSLCESDVRRMVEMLTANVRPSKQSRDMRRVSLPIPPGANYIYERLLKDSKNVNNCIEYFLCTGKRDDSSVRTRTMLFHQLCSESVSHQLRTTENLGYVVRSSVRPFRTTYGFSVTIQSRQSPKYLESRVEAFLDAFKDRLSSMSEKDFEAHKCSLNHRLAEKPKNLAEEGTRQWNQIFDGNYDFEQDLRDATKVQALTKTDMVAFFNTYIQPGSNTRAKVSVHLLSRSSSPVSETITEGGSDKSIYVKSINEFRAVIRGGDGFKR